MNFIASLKKASFPMSDQRYGGQGKMKVRPVGERAGQGGYQQQSQRFAVAGHMGHSYNIVCKWEPFREQILTQWSRLSSWEVDALGPNRSKLAMLIENKYGIAAHLVENYLRNFERTLPLM